MTNRETTDGFAQLSLSGIKTGTIVRRTGVKKTTVDKHLAVARAEGASACGVPDLDPGRWPAVIDSLRRLDMIASACGRRVRLTP
jgi:hypothetical protein